jgi:subtilisin family serine protease
MNNKEKRSSLIFSILPFLVVFSILPIKGQFTLRQHPQAGRSISIFADLNETITPEVIPTEITVTETPGFGTATPEITQTPEPSQSPTSTTIPTLEPSPTPIPSEIPIEEQPGKVQIFIAKDSFSFIENFSLNMAQMGNCKIAVELAKIGVTLAEIPEEDLETTLDTLENDRNVIYAETVGDVQALDLIPNDPGFVYQPELRQVHAPQAWDTSTGSDQVTIAVIDSGVDRYQPDLGNKLLSGCDFVNEDEDTSDENGHGTHVAGIAAASGSDGYGMAGVSWGARILPVKVLDSGGNGNYATLAAGIIWAADHGVQIINLSLGGVSNNLTLKAAVDYALSRGVLVIAASGNDGTRQLRFPAAYTDVLAVGSVDANNAHSVFSNFGEGLDLVAPGEQVYSTIPGGFDRKTGTSMSVPFVSGLAAILWGLPGNANSYQVQSQINHSAQDLGVYGWDEQYGFGLLRMDRAIQAAQIKEEPSVHKKTRTPTGQIPPDGVYQSTTVGTPISDSFQKGTQMPTEQQASGKKDLAVIPVTSENDSQKVSQENQTVPGSFVANPGDTITGGLVSIIAASVCLALLRRKYPLEK